MREKQFLEEEKNAKTQASSSVAGEEVVLPVRNEKNLNKITPDLVVLKDEGQT